MSVRDEIARATAEAMDAWAAMSRVDEPAQTVERWVADALLPIVERVAREMYNAGWHERHMYDVTGQCKTDDFWVRRVCGE